MDGNLSSFRLYVWNCVGASHLIGAHMFLLVESWGVGELEGRDLAAAHLESHANRSLPPVDWLEDVGDEKFPFFSSHTNALQICYLA